MKLYGVKINRDNCAIAQLSALINSQNYTQRCREDSNLREMLLMPIFDDSKIYTSWVLQQMLNLSSRNF